MTNEKDEPPGAATKQLWAMHVQGPDDVWAAPSKERAVAAAKRLNDFWAEKIATKNDPDFPMINAMVVPWNSSPESHAEAVKKWAAEWERTDA